MITASILIILYLMGSILGYIIFRSHYKEMLFAFAWWEHLMYFLGSWLTVAFFVQQEDW